MHWLLEHAGDTPDGWRAERATQAQRRFALAPEQARHAAAMARRIVTGEAAWAWSASEVLEAFDEVELVHQGQRLRIDRLVRRRAGAHGPEAWWVLDYKRRPPRAQRGPASPAGPLPRRRRAPAPGAGSAGGVPEWEGRVVDA
jgi:hypothetical protein